MLTLSQSIVTGARSYEAKVSRARPERVRSPMNKTEARFAEVLDARIADGTLVEYWYEDYTFRLGDDCRYTPDFVLALPDGTLEVVEVKSKRRGGGDGYYAENDAHAKIRVFSRQFPFRIRVVWESALGVWREKRIGGD